MKTLSQVTMRARTMAKPEGKAENEKEMRNDQSGPKR